MKQKRLLFLLVLLLTATAGAWAQTGMINGLFSVSATKKVYFSKGNLQLVGENKFQFAENQWDYFGINQSDNHRDLFCWGTGNNPNQTTGNSTFTDWGDNTYLQAALGKGWRTMTKDEFAYVFNTRASGSSVFGIADGRYTAATINTDGTGVKGIILFPDGITIEASEVTTAGTINGTSTVTQCTKAQWAALAGKGCVFLPAAGFILSGTGIGYGDITDYWTSTAADASKAYNLGLNLGFSGAVLNPAGTLAYNYGCAVRLVIDQYYLTLADGTKDAAKWTAKVGEGQAQALPIGGLKGDGSEMVTLKYNGRLKVKSVKAEKKGVDPAKAYLKWDATKKELVEAEIPAGATTVTSSTTNVTWDAGTYVVEGNITIGGMITLNGNVDLIIKDGAKLTANQIGGNSKNLSIYGQANQTGQLIVNSSGGHAIFLITTLNVHSCQVTATSSGIGSNGFSGITTINVYGGSVDAESTGDYGNGIKLPSEGSMNIYGGEVKVVGKGNFSGIGSSSATTITVYGGKLWAENAGFKAIDFGHVTLTKGTGFNGKIEYSSDNSTWSETKDTGAKYVRVGY